MKDRRRDTRLALMFKIIKGKVAVEVEGTLQKADSRTRSQHSYKYRHLNASTTQYKNSFFARTIPEWNSLPEACISADNVPAFVAQLRALP